tara:strand:+ start:2190 stop:2429 length:240 start_codon:yes stop_codon:yes gene_type:complete
MIKNHKIRVTLKSLKTMRKQVKKSNTRIIEELDKKIGELEIEVEKPMCESAQKQLILTVVEKLLKLIPSVKALINLFNS